MDYDGKYVFSDATLERQKGCNMCANPRVALPVITPGNSSREREIEVSE